MARLLQHVSESFTKVTPLRLFALSFLKLGALKLLLAPSFQCHEAQALVLLSTHL